MSIFLIALLCIHQIYSRSCDTLTADDYPSSATELPTSCNNLEDGFHWIRPMADAEDKFPNIYVKCDDGYAIINPSLFDIYNYHHPKAYFSTYSDVTDFVASSSLNDHVTWREWYLPADEDTIFRISEDCSTCSNTDDYGENSVYYMTGNYNGCLWVTKGYCDMDPDSLECYECTAPYLDEPVSGLCTHMWSDADHPVNSAHDDCVGTSYNAEPSIGTLGQFCVCYKTRETNMVPASQWNVPYDDNDDNDQTKDTIIEIYSTDFTDGTYKITKPGIYKIMEDISFEMNTGDLSNPNDPGYWYPKEDQEGDYMGAGGSFIGPYAMGFFAGFTVEADDVTIDLNGYELSMSKVFHIQQRWFSIIEIGSKAFISGQGPANFGPYMTYAKNTIIKNGVVGRSSHHGIHANGVENLLIQDVIVKHFEVAGMSVNGFVNLNIENVEVGPVYQQVPVMGVYTQARIMLPRLRKVAEDNPTGTVTFYGRGSYTADEVLDNLQTQMDIIFRHVIGGKSYAEMHDEPKEKIEAARKTFENHKGLPSSSTAYGIFLNSYGASVFAISGSPGFSNGANINNLHIHGLYKDPWEVPRIVLTKGPFNDIMDFTRVTDDGLETTNSKYIGSAYTDAQYAIHKLATDWGVLGHSVIGSKVDSWISKGKSMGAAKTRCNGDIMLHVTKGVFGFRIDNVLGLNINNLQIDDLQNIGELGSYVCGNYESLEDGGHRNQNFPLQRGFTGTEVHALSFVASQGIIDNVNIHNIVSARGDALAMNFFPSNEITIGKNINIHDIHAGAAIPKDLLTTIPDNMPNKIPRACAIDVWTWTDEEGEFTKNQITFQEKESISAKCLTFHTECSNSAYDHEAMDSFITECDDDNIVKSHSTKNQDIYEKYISKLSDDHQKLFNIMKDHSTPNFFPQRAFPDKSNLLSSKIEKTIPSIQLIYVMIASILVFAVWKFTTSTKTNIKFKSINKTDKTSDDEDEYEPLIADEQLYKDYTVQ